MNLKEIFCTYRPTLGLCRPYLKASIGVKIATFLEKMGDEAVDHEMGKFLDGCLGMDVTPFNEDRPPCPYPGPYIGLYRGGESACMGTQK